MTNKTTRIIAIVLMAIPSLMLVMSGVIKLMAAPQIVEGLGKMGLASYITLFGIIELIAVALFVYPKTNKIGFLLICCYLGGALSIELASGQKPTAAALLVLLWVSVFLTNKAMFLVPATTGTNK